jgi:glyoxylase-like metal-dependent hydrolase (beta-lactamase superfamily II)
MLKTSTYDDVSIYKMGRSIGKFVPYAVHCFLLADTLIDAGTRFAGGEFLSAIEGRQINKIINTHFHEDHVGLNHTIQQKYSAQIFAHKDSIPNIENPRNVKLRLYQKHIWDYPESSKVKQIGDSVVIGQYQFQVIHVPGHSAGNICLYQPQKKWLFTGDMFCGIKNIYLRRDEDFNLILQSLENLSKLEIDTIFCCLKGVVTNGGQALAAKIRYMKDLRDKIFFLHQAGLTAKKIRKKLIGPEDLMFLITGGHFSKQFLVDNILESMMTGKQSNH